MKLLYFYKDASLHLGVATQKGVVDITTAQRLRGDSDFTTGNVSIDDLPQIKSIVEQATSYLEEDSLSIATCTPFTNKIICIGLNYRQHAIESGMDIPEIPIVFSKYNNSLCNFQEAVPLDEAGKEYDYEVELGVVIGKKAKNISKENALEYVLGYCVANDLSCRDLQFRSSQWLMGKTQDKFLPLGKYVATTDEVPDPHNLRLTCSLNGEIRQDSNTGDMIFSIAEIIEDLSKHFTLVPGDLILTGTPFGVIMGMKEKDWLKAGDSVTVEIEKLGSTTNVMA